MTSIDSKNLTTPLSNHYMQTIRQLWKIGRAIAKYNLLWLFDKTPKLRLAVKILTLPIRPTKAAKGKSRGENLCDALQNLGPIFIKFGQILSVRSDIIGDDMAKSLTQLQDNLPAFPSHQAIKIIEESLGDSIDNLFAEFNETPTNAASIAQVHKAKTHAGEEVAVKILRPNIDKIFARDLKSFKTIAKLLHIFMPSVRRLRPQSVIEVFEEWTKTELDLTLEGASACKMAENFKSRSEKIHIPKIYWDLTHTNILTSEWINGYRIDDIQALQDAGLDLSEVQLSAARIFFMQIFYDGFFHADMHAGNIFIRADGYIVPIDFGIMGHVDKRTLLFLADLLIGFFEGDYERISNAHFDYGIVPENHSRHVFALAMRAIGEPLQGLSLNEISVGRLLAQLFRTTRQFDMQTQPQLLLLQKTIFMSEGLGRILDERANMWVLARPLIEDWGLLHYSFEARLVRIAERLWAWIEGHA